MQIDSGEVAVVIFALTAFVLLLVDCVLFVKGDRERAMRGLFALLIGGLLGFGVAIVIYATLAIFALGFPTGFTEIANWIATFIGVGIMIFSFYFSVKRHRQIGHA